MSTKYYNYLLAIISLCMASVCYGDHSKDDPEEGLVVIASYPFYETSQVKSTLEPLVQFLETELKNPIKIAIPGKLAELLTLSKSHAYDILIMSNYLTEQVVENGYHPWIRVENPYKSLVVSRLAIGDGNLKLLQGKRVAGLSKLTHIYNLFHKRMGDDIDYEFMEVATNERSLIALLNRSADAVITFEQFYNRLPEHQKQYLNVYELERVESFSTIFLNKKSEHFETLKDSAPVFIDNYKHNFSSYFNNQILLTPL